jgi:hypothetical protein
MSMAAVMVQIRPKPPVDAGVNHPEASVRRPAGPAVSEPEGVELVEDMDVYVEHVMCSCSAGDDNPY